MENYFTSDKMMWSLVVVLYTDTDPQPKYEQRIFNALFAVQSLSIELTKKLQIKCNKLQPSV